LTTTRPIDSNASRAWLNEKVSREASAHHPLIQEVGKRLVSHAEWIKLDPNVWLEWRSSVGGDAVRNAFTQRFQNAQHHHWEPTHALWQEVQDERSKGSWMKQTQAWLNSKLKPVQPWVGDLSPSCVDFIVSNLSLHHEPEPERTFAHWAQALRPEGVVLFSALGPDTLRELHDLYLDMNWAAPAHPLIDMHDLGDMLVHSGFSDPVVDMERLVLTYSDAQTFLKDLRALGRNMSPNRFAAMRGRKFLSDLLAALENRKAETAGGRFSMTFEVIYGHAFKARAKEPKSSEVKLDLDSVRAQLKKPRI